MKYIKEEVEKLGYLVLREVGNRYYVTKLETLLTNIEIYRS